MAVRPAPATATQRTAWCVGAPGNERAAPHRLGGGRGAGVVGETEHGDAFWRRRRTVWFRAREQRVRTNEPLTSALVRLKRARSTQGARVHSGHAARSTQARRQLAGGGGELGHAWNRARAWQSKQEGQGGKVAAHSGHAEELREARGRRSSADRRRCLRLGGEGGTDDGGGCRLPARISARTKETSAELLDSSGLRGGWLGGRVATAAGAMAARWSEEQRSSDGEEEERRGRLGPGVGGLYPRPGGCSERGRRGRRGGNGEPWRGAPVPAPGERAKASVGWACSCLAVAQAQATVSRCFSFCFKLFCLFFALF